MSVPGGRWHGELTCCHGVPFSEICLECEPLEIEDSLDAALEVAASRSITEPEIT